MAGLIYPAYPIGSYGFSPSSLQLSFANDAWIAFGYSGLAVRARVTGVIVGRSNLRPEPFYFLAVVVVLAFFVSTFLIKETIQYAKAEVDEERHDANLRFMEVLKRATFEDKTLFAAAQAGHFENFVDTLFWIAVPLYLTSQGLGIAAVGVVLGVHSAMYFFQIGTGGLADRVGRRPPVVMGMFTAGIGVLGMLVVQRHLGWVAMAGLSGGGMAVLYPNLMTVPADACHPSWRAIGMGVYRMWRDAGYGVGAIVIGLSMEVPPQWTPRSTLLVSSWLCQGYLCISGWRRPIPNSAVIRLRHLPPPEGSGRTA